MTILSCVGNRVAGLLMAGLHSGAASTSGRNRHRQAGPGGGHDRRIHHRRHAAPNDAQWQVVRRLSGRFAENLWRRQGPGSADSHPRQAHVAPPAGCRPLSRRGLHGWRPPRGGRRHPRLHDPADDQRGAGRLSAPGALAGQPAPTPATSARAQHPPPGAAQRGAPLRPGRQALRPVPGLRPAVFLRLFRRAGLRPGRSATGQEAAPGGQAAHSARHAHPGHRLRLGRAGAVSGAGLRRCAGGGHHPFHRAAGARPRGWG